MERAHHQLNGTIFFKQNGSHSRGICYSGPWHQSIYCRHLRIQCFIRNGTHQINETDVPIQSQTGCKSAYLPHACKASGFVKSMENNPSTEGFSASRVVIACTAALLTLAIGNSEAVADPSIHNAVVVELSPRAVNDQAGNNSSGLHADAGPDRSQRSGSTLWLDASSDSPPTGGNDTKYFWAVNNVEIGRGQLAPANLPVGRHTVQLTVIDSNGRQATDETVVTIYQPKTINVGSNRFDVTKILDRVQTSTASRHTQMTPIATADGYVYTANIEHGPNGDENGARLRTVLRQGYQNETNGWVWNTVLVEDRTVHDAWHTAPSVAVDSDGQVHIAYNMHNTPWQYKRTVEPHNIDSLGFLGQAITTPELERWAYQGLTAFPSLGHAAIPANQITYPRFEHDRNGDLYLTYRFAAKPARVFAERTFSSGIASYDTAKAEWNALGSPVPLVAGDADGFNPGDEPLAFASAEGWTSYLPQLMFSGNNQMHVASFWRRGLTGAQYTHPCFMQHQSDGSFSTVSGRAASKPVQPQDCQNIGFPANAAFSSVFDSEMDSQGNAYLAVSPTQGERQLVTYNNDSGTWQHESLPSSAREIFLDGEDNLWAVASGPRIFRRDAASGEWQGPIGNTRSDGNCLAKAVVSDDQKHAFIHAMACDNTSISVYAIRLL